MKRRIRSRLRRLRYSRRARLTAIGLGGLVVLGGIWIVVTGLLARSQLSDLQNRITLAKTLIAQGRVDDARTVAKDIPAMADRASRLTTGPAWWIAAHVPYFGEPLQVVRTTTDVTQELGSSAIPKLLDVASLINPTTLRAGGDTVRLAPLITAAPKLQQVATSLARATARIDALPDTWLGLVDTKRAALKTQLTTVRGYVDAAARAARVLPAMMGDHGRTLRYFIGLQNESELRGTGGLPGAFAIARVHDGTLTFERFESDTVLLPPKTDQLIDTKLDFGASYNALYGASLPTKQYVDSNVSPHFPYTARIWAAMWQKVSGQHVDGVLAVDPTALAYFLTATGPAGIPGSATPVTAADVVNLTERDAYTLYPDNNQRKTFLVNVLKAAAKKLTSGAGSPYNLIQATSLASREQRLLAWSSDPTVEKLLEQTTYAGDIASTGRPLSALIVNNAAAGKLDYYLQRTLQYRRTGCGARRDVLVTFTLTNTAPASGLPPYVTDRLDKNPPADAKPGDNRSIVDYYATGGSILQSVEIDGKVATASVVDTLGRAVFRFDLEIPLGTTRTVVLHLDEPAGKGSPQVWRQPGVTPLDVTVVDQHC